MWVVCQIVFKCWIIFQAKQLCVVTEALSICPWKQLFPLPRTLFTRVIGMKGQSEPKKHYLIQLKAHRIVLQLHLYSSDSPFLLSLLSLAGPWIKNTFFFFHTTCSRFLHNTARKSCPVKSLFFRADELWDPCTNFFFPSIDESDYTVTNWAISWYVWDN